MITGKVFKSGNSQAIRLPKSFRLECDEVMITRSGNDLILHPIPNSWVELHKKMIPITNFMDERDDFSAQERESF